MTARGAAAPDAPVPNGLVPNESAPNAALSPALRAALVHPMVAAVAERLAQRPGTRAVVAPTDRVPRRAAVALVLRAGPDRSPGDVELLFVKRAEYPGDPWSGHVAFPGGRHEPHDATLWDTAARETWEETGLDLARDGHVLGTLDEIHPRTPTLPPIVVRPYVVVAAPATPLVLSEELAGAFWVPLGRFGEPGVARPSTVLVRGGVMTVPSFVHAADAAIEHVIWGMTERILRQLLALVGVEAPGD